MADDFRLKLDRTQIALLDDDADMRAVMQRAGDEVARYATVLAPKRTGAGARSIHAEVGHDGGSWYADVSWDQDHFYMIFQEFGTSSQPERPFLRPAFDRYMRL